MRTGIGYDIHRLMATTTTAGVPLGGVTIPCLYRVEAHSDGDVLLHALVDACLGALALGDIGQWFPDSSAEHKGKPSREFVREVLARIHDLGWRVTHFDSIVLLEEPKLKAHREAIRLSIAELLGLPLDSVSLKAKTMEGLGPIGEKQALAAHVVVQLERSADAT